MEIDFTILKEMNYTTYYQTQTNKTLPKCDSHPTHLREITWISEEDVVLGSWMRWSGEKSACCELKYLTKCNCPTTTALKHCWILYHVLLQIWFINKILWLPTYLLIYNRRKTVALKQNKTYTTWSRVWMHQTLTRDAICSTLDRKISIHMSTIVEHH